VIAEYRIAARDGAVPTATLSGGNLQKLLLARAVLQATAADRSVLVAVNPTNGLDVATTLFVHGRLVDLQQRGRGLLLISEDLDELTSLCDRILVMRRGRIVGEITRGAYDLYAIGALMTGAGPAAVQTASGPR
jgi:simple sugar transport system ATP-binding protein